MDALTSLTSSTSEALEPSVDATNSQGTLDAPKGRRRLQSDRDMRATVAQKMVKDQGADTGQRGPEAD